MTENNSQSKSFLLLEDVVKKNGEEHLYDPIMELIEKANNEDDEPLIIFSWEKNNVENFVAAMNGIDPCVAASPPLPPPALNITPNMDVNDFKVAVLNYAKIPGAKQDPLGTTALPCTLAESLQGICLLTMLETHPWTQHIIAQGNNVNTILPIATICVPRPGSNNVLDCAMTSSLLWC